MKENPTGILVIRASPPAGGVEDKTFGGLVSIGLRSVGLLQAEVSRNDLENTGLINDALLARDRMWQELTQAGNSPEEVLRLLAPLDAPVARHRFVPVPTIQPNGSASGRGRVCHDG